MRSGDKHTLPVVTHASTIRSHHRWWLMQDIASLTSLQISIRPRYNFSNLKHWLC